MEAGVFFFNSFLSGGEPQIAASASMSKVRAFILGEGGQAHSVSYLCDSGNANRRGDNIHAKYELFYVFSNRHCIFATQLVLQLANQARDRLSIIFRVTLTLPVPTLCIGNFIVNRKIVGTRKTVRSVSSPHVIINLSPPSQLFLHNYINNIT